MRQEILGYCTYSTTWHLVSESQLTRQNATWHELPRLSESPSSKTPQNLHRGRANPAVDPAPNKRISWGWRPDTPRPDGRTEAAAAAATTAPRSLTRRSCSPGTRTRRCSTPWGPGASPSPRPVSVLTLCDMSSNSLASVLDAVCKVDLTGQPRTYVKKQK